MRHGAILLVVVVGLAACGEEVLAPRAEFHLELQGDWRLESGSHRDEQIALVAGYPITLTIESEEASGRSGCNMYGGSVRVDGRSVSFSNLAGTEMGCRRDVMDAEEAYLAALGSVNAASREGGALVLLGPEAELRFAAVSPGPSST